MWRRYKLNKVDEGIILDIAHKLKAHLKQWYGKEARLDPESPRVKIYKSSFILRYSVTVFENRKYILVKIRRDSFMYSIAQAIRAPGLHVNMREEFLSLEEIYKFFNRIEEGVGAVRPLAHFDQWHALVMEEYPSKSLRQIIMQQQSLFHRQESMSRLLDSAKKTGRWLYLYHHTLHAASCCQELETEFMEAVQRYTAQLEDISQGKIDTQSIEKAFTQTLGQIQTAQFYISTTHGDMTCDNILYSADKTVCAIDVKGKDAPVYTDLGLILIHPETFLPQVFSLGFFFRERFLKVYRKAILDGYFGNDLKDGLLLNLYCSLMLLDKWVRYEDNATRYRGIKRLVFGLLSPIPKLYYRNRINKYLRSNTLADCGYFPP